MYSVSEIPSKRSLASQVVLCEEHSLAPMVDSEYGVNVCIDSADERRCVVSCTSDCSIEEDPAVWTCMTNNSWTYGGIPKCEPQACADLSLGSSVVSDCDGTLYSHTETASCLSGYVAIPCISDGTLPRCVLLGGTGQKFDGLEDFAHTCDGVGLGDHFRAEGVHGVAGTFPCVWTK